MKMPGWVKELKLTAAVAVGILLAGVTTGAALDGWLTLPSEVAELATKHSADSLVTMQNRRSVADLRIVTGQLTSGLGELVERVRRIDRRTCIAAAVGRAELEECADL